MTTDAKPRLKITYATLRNDNEELHALYEAGLSQARTELGGHHRNLIAGQERDGDGDIRAVASPIDRDIVVGTFRHGHPPGRARCDRRGARRPARPGRHARGTSAWRSCGGPPS